MKGCGLLGGSHKALSCEHLKKSYIQNELTHGLKPHSIGYRGGGHSSQDRKLPSSNASSL